MAQPHLPTLQLLVSTIDDGIARLPQLLLPPHRQIGYVVTWQQTEHCSITELPAEIASRSDVVVKVMPGRGLSRSRNECLRNATADCCLIADDDCRYTIDGLNALMQCFERHPQVQIATVEFSSTSSPKVYPGGEYDLSRPPKGHYVSSIEIAFRREAVQGLLWFDEHFGLGSGIYQCGEDELFVNRALKAGLKGCHFPVVVAHHPCGTTASTRATEPGVLMARGRLLGITSPATSLPRALLMARRVSKMHNTSFFDTLKLILKGLFKMAEKSN